MKKHSKLAEVDTLHAQKLKTWHHVAILVIILPNDKTIH